MKWPFAVWLVLKTGVVVLIGSNIDSTNGEKSE